MIMDSVRDLSKEKDIIRIIGRIPDCVLKNVLAIIAAMVIIVGVIIFCPILLLILLFVPSALKVFVRSFL